MGRNKKQKKRERKNWQNYQIMGTMRKRKRALQLHRRRMPESEELAEIQRHKAASLSVFLHLLDKQKRTRVVATTRTLHHIQITSILNLCGLALLGRKPSIRHDYELCTC